MPSTNTPNQQFINLTRIYKDPEDESRLKEQPYTVNKAFIASVRPSNALGSDDVREHRSTIIIGNTEVCLKDTYSTVKSYLGCG